MIWLFTLWWHAHAVMVVLDMNNAPKEFGACMDAAGDQNVVVVSSLLNDGKPVGPKALNRKLNQLKALGIPVDGIYLSGHQGPGHFFGEGGQIYASDFTNVMDQHPEIKNASLGLVGCYTGGYDANMESWAKPNPGIRQTFGFPLQSPTKKDADTATLVGAFCKSYKDWAKHSTREELCTVYPALAALTRQTVSLCSREAIASTAYGDKMCYSFEELEARCKEFDPGSAGARMYAAYLNADGCDPRFDNPPSDKNSAYESAGGSPLRDFYSQVHLWRHCADQLKTDRGYRMPSTPKMIRLIKYDTVKENIANLNAAELADYDRRLHDLCLDDLRLGDVRKLNRHQLNAKINGALEALAGAGENALVSDARPAGEAGRAPAAAMLLGAAEEIAPKPKGKAEPHAMLTPKACAPEDTRPAPGPQACPSAKTNPVVVEKMARLLRNTFVDLNYHAKRSGEWRTCSAFQLVEPKADERFKSRCVVGYDEARSL